MTVFVKVILAFDSAALPYSMKCSSPVGCMHCPMISDTFKCRYHTLRHHLQKASHFTPAAALDSQQSRLVQLATSKVLPKPSSLVAMNLHLTEGVINIYGEGRPDCNHTYMRYPPNRYPKGSCCNTSSGQQVNYQVQSVRKVL